MHIKRIETFKTIKHWRGFFETPWTKIIERCEIKFAWSRRSNNHDLFFDPRDLARTPSDFETSVFRRSRWIRIDFHSEVNKNIFPTRDKLRSICTFSGWRCETYLTDASPVMGFELGAPGSHSDSFASSSFTAFLDVPTWQKVRNKFRW